MNRKEKAKNFIRKTEQISPKQHPSAIYEKDASFSLWLVFSKQIGSLIGLCLLVLTGAMAAALLSWNALDPSFSIANDNLIKNHMGHIGAIYADLSMQFFGLSGAFLLVPCFCWSIFLIIQKLDFSLWRCVISIPIFLSFFCFAFTLYPVTVTNSFLLPQGLGGRVGRFFFDLWWQESFSSDFIFLSILSAFFMCLTGFFFLFIASGLIFPKYPHKAEQETRILDELGFWEGWLGFFYHIRLILLSKMKRFFGHLCHRIRSFSLFTKATTEGYYQGQAGDRCVPPPISYEEKVTEESVFFDSKSCAKNMSKDNRKAPESHKRADDLSFAHWNKNFLFKLPSLSYLSCPEKNPHQQLTKEQMEQNCLRLLRVLKDFGIHGQVLSMCVGPIVTLYEFEPAPGIKSSRIIALTDDIARSMCALSARVSVIAGRNAIGIELPNEERETIYLREILESKVFFDSCCTLPLALGKMIDGDIIVADLAKMPHLLVAGTTGSGKSVAMHSMVLSLLYRLSPEQCRFIMIDPKMLELSVYEGIPHLLTSVVTDPKKAIIALKWAVREMEARYAKMAKAGVRNITGFNEKVKEAREQGENLTRKIQTGFDQATGQALYEEEVLDNKELPYIVVLIDEMADLMLVAGKEIEAAVQRLAQMARAAGIHVIMATQRPSVDVITGTIKANFPTRISFSVTSKIDSRTILGEQGAEQLLGQGDMLFMFGGRKSQRVHGPFVFDHEVQAIVNHLKAQASPDYLEDITIDKEEDEGGSLNNLAASQDPYDQAVAIMLQDKRISTSYIQRRLGIGYNRAASIIERMEQEGLISPANHVGKREILVSSHDE